MNIRKQIQQLAAENAITITEVDSNCHLLTVPVSGDRRQQVKAEVIKNNLYDRDVMRFSSAVAQQTADGTILSQLLTQAAYFQHCRFTIRDGFIWVEAILSAEDPKPGLLTEVLTEVANLADQYEKRLTGEDRH